MRSSLSAEIAQRTEDLNKIPTSGLQYLDTFRKTQEFKQLKITGLDVSHMKRTIKNMDDLCKNIVSQRENGELKTPEAMNLKDKCQLFESVYTLYDTLYSVLNSDKNSELTPFKERYFGLHSLLEDTKQFHAIFLSALEITLNKLISELEDKYLKLFICNDIEYIEEIDKPLDKIKDVGQGYHYVIKIKDGLYTGLGTYGLGPCIAFAARGNDRDGNVILGLTHYDGTTDPEDALRTLAILMKENGAQEDFTIALVGGMHNITQNWPHDTCSTLMNEEKLLSLAEKYHITAVRLHPSYCMGTTEPCDAVILQDKIVFSFKTLYNYDASEYSGDEYFSSEERFEFNG